MKNAIFKGLAIVTILLTSCTAEVYLGSGDIVSETRTLPSLDKLKVSGVFEVNIRYGTTQEVEILADDNILNKIRTRVINNKLVVDFKDGNYRNVSATINLTLEDLKEVHYTGSGFIEIDDFFELGTLDLENIGSGSFYLNQGSSTKLKWRNEGSGSLEAKNFMASEINIDIKGSGDSYVNCSELLDVAIEGSGNVYYLGEPTLNMNISGSGRVVRLNE